MFDHARACRLFERGDRLFIHAAVIQWLVAAIVR